jgi:hypothetical protein
VNDDESIIMATHAFTMESFMKWKIRYLFFVLACSTALPACAGSLRYSAAPIEAWVVDKETDQPLEGVIVVAHWALERTSRLIPHQTNRAGSLMILEAVTDKDGRFYFPAWGPKWHLGSGELTDSDPELILFKSDYKYLRVSNSQYMRPSKYSDVGKPSGTESKPTGSKRISFWSGERIKLERFKGTEKEYAEHVHSLDNGLEFARYGEDCEWKKIPRMLIALHRMSEYFDSKGVKLRGWQIGARIRKVTDVGNEKQCGSPQEFFKVYQP